MLPIFQKIANSRTQNDLDLGSVINQAARIFNYKNTRLYIEEPEQNLFPESQQSLIGHIVARINDASQTTGMSSAVTITTHSPYVVTAFNVLIRAAQAEKKDQKATYQIVPQEQIVSIDEIRAYYIREDGTMSDIRDTEIGMISGTELDHASDCVEDKLTLLNDIIYAE